MQPRDPVASDPVDLNALQHQVQHLPAETLLLLLGSRYCETDRLSDEAWRLFGQTPLGWPRVQAICDFVHNHITLRLRALPRHQNRVRSIRRASRRLSRLRTPGGRVLPQPEHPGARYCTGYVTDIGLPPPYAPMDFAAWIEVYLGGRWHTF